MIAFDPSKMAKILILSILVMMVVIPVRLSHARFAPKGLRQALVAFFAFNLVYWVSVLFIYFTLILGRSPTELLSHTVHD